MKLGFVLSFKGKMFCENDIDLKGRCPNIAGSE
jgi:hypothetical protein